MMSAWDSSQSGAKTGLSCSANSMPAAAGRQRTPIEIVFRPNGPERSLRENAVDVWAAAVPTPERRRHLYFTAPWWTQDHYIAVRSDSGIDSVAGLAGRTLLYSPVPPLTTPLNQVFPDAHFQPAADLRQNSSVQTAWSYSDINRIYNFEAGEFNDEFMEIKAGLKSGETILLRAPDSEKPGEHADRMRLFKQIAGRLGDEAFQGGTECLPADTALQQLGGERTAAEAQRCGAGGQVSQELATIGHGCSSPSVNQFSCANLSSWNASASAS